MFLNNFLGAFLILINNYIIFESNLLLSCFFLIMQTLKLLSRELILMMY